MDIDEHPVMLEVKRGYYVMMKTGLGHLSSGLAASNNIETARQTKQIRGQQQTGQRQTG